MATKIEWGDETWNPITGCSKISEGCQNCYAERMSKRLAGRFGYPADKPFKVTLHEDKLDEPLKWRKPRRVFVCSMGDLFHENVPDKAIIDVLSVIAECEYQKLNHVFMILTKRPGRMLELFTNGTIHNDVWVQTSRGCNAEPSLWPLPNLWLGVTVENQQRADERIPILLQIPAAKRFVSVEPMLGSVDLTFDAGTGQGLRDSFFSYGLDWVICGGETGPGARPMHPDWVRSLRDQCTAAGTPFFFKSWGNWVAPSQMPGNTYREIVDFGSGIGITDNQLGVGKKRAGRLLDGREWNQYPWEG